MRARSSWRHRLEQFLRLRRVARGAREGLAVLREALLQRGQQQVADAVAREAGVGVGRVLHHGHAVLAHPVADRAGRQRQQGPHEQHAVALEHRRHRRHAGQPGTAAERQQ